MTVCEYGSGGSTLFFSARVKSILSIEDNAKWFDVVARRLEENRISNVALTLHPFDVANPVGFEDSAYLLAIGDEHFDVVVVDGSEGDRQVRPACFAKAESRINPGGIIVLDDSWRYPDLRRRHHAKDLRVFQSVGPCRPGVTSTDVFFY
jgi:predicted O-methyltransferase YrrM